MHGPYRGRPIGVKVADKAAGFFAEIEKLQLSIHKIENYDGENGE